MPVTVKIKIDGLTKISKAVAGNAELGRRISDSWSIIFRSFIRLRFLKFSRGGGDWKPLAASTLAKRRKGKGGRGARDEHGKFLQKGAASAAILRDMGLMFAALQPTLNGGQGLLQSTPRVLGFTITLDSPQGYPGSPTTLGDVARYHQLGGKHLPKREILVPPDKPTIGEMAEKAKAIVAKWINRAKGAG